VPVLLLSQAEGLLPADRTPQKLRELAGAAYTVAVGHLRDGFHTVVLQGHAPLDVNQPERATTVLSWQPGGLESAKTAALGLLLRRSPLSVPCGDHMVYVPVRQQAWFPQPYTAELRLTGTPSFGGLQGAAAAFLQSAGLPVTEDPNDHSAAFVVSERLGAPVGPGGRSLAPDALTNVLFARVRGPSWAPSLSQLDGCRFPLPGLETLRVSVTSRVAIPACVLPAAAAAAQPAAAAPQVAAGPPAAAGPPEAVAPQVAQPTLAVHAAAAAPPAVQQTADVVAAQQAVAQPATTVAAAAQPAADVQQRADAHMEEQQALEDIARAWAASQQRAQQAEPGPMGGRALAAQPTPRQVAASKPTAAQQGLGPAKPVAKQAGAKAAPKGLAGGFLQGKGGLGGKAAAAPAAAQAAQPSGALPTPRLLRRSRSVASTASMASAGSADDFLPYAEEPLTEEEGMALLTALVAGPEGLHHTEGGHHLGLPLKPLSQHLLGVPLEICSVPAGRQLVVRRALGMAEYWSPLLADSRPGAPLPDAVAEYLVATAEALQLALTSFRVALPGRGRRHKPGGAGGQSGAGPSQPTRPSSCRPSPGRGRRVPAAGEVQLPAAPELPAARAPGVRSRSRSPARAPGLPGPPVAAAAVPRYKAPHLRRHGAGLPAGGPT
jgi:hypothetical protein